MDDKNLKINAVGVVEFCGEREQAMQAKGYTKGDIRRCPTNRAPIE
jgi:hypothetical protein